MDKSVQTESVASNATAMPLPSDPKADKYRKLVGIKEITDDIYLKLNSIQTVLGYLLEKTKDLPEPTSEASNATAMPFPVEKKISEEVNASENPQDA